MKATQLLSNMDQSLWLDNITRELLDTGTLKRYIDDFSTCSSSGTASAGATR
jgi:transaldolase